MSDRYQRLLCRALFVLLVIAPTVAVVYRIATPVSVAQRQLQLEQALGVPVTIGAARTPDPQTLVLTDVELGGTLPSRSIQLREIRVSQRSGQTSVTVPGPADFFAPPAANIAADIAERLIHRLPQNQTWVFRGTRIKLLRQGGQQSAAQGLASQVPAADSPDEYLLSEVVAHVAASERARRIAIKARPVAAPPTQYLSIELETVYGGSEPVFRMRVDTGQQHVPVWVIESLVPMSRWLGDRATVRGQMEITSIGGHSQGTFVGNIDELDLYTLVYRQFGQQLSGIGAVEIERARWLDGRVVHLDATLHCASGRIGSKLLESLPRFLRVELPHVNPGPVTDFRDLNVKIQLREGILSLAGNQAGVIATDHSQRSLAIVANRAPVSVESLARLLSASHGTEALTTPAIKLLSHTVWHGAPHHEAANSMPRTD